MASPSTVMGAHRREAVVVKEYPRTVRMCRGIPRWGSRALPSTALGTPWGDVVTTPCSMGNIHVSTLRCTPPRPCRSCFLVNAHRDSGHLRPASSESRSERIVTCEAASLTAVGGVLDALSSFPLKLRWKAPRGNGSACCRQ